jgi:bifunctional non-homologous end joining protein LigD
MQKELPIITPIQPQRRDQPFDRENWIFELKYDGFRGLAYIMDGKIRLRSKTTAILQGFHGLKSALEYELRVHDTVLDGEIVSFDATGHIRFNQLMDRKGRIGYFAFDLLIHNGEDLRMLPLLERKQRLRRILPEDSDTLLFADHVPEHGIQLFDFAQANDQEGIIAKPADSPYKEGVSWYKIKNLQYSGLENRPDVGEFRSGRKRAS